MVKPLRNHGIAALVLAVLFIPTAAATSPPTATNIYGSLSGVFVMPKDSSVKYREDEFRLSGDMAMDNGYGILGAVGYGWRFRPNTELRGEIEFGYRASDFDELKGLAMTLPQEGLKIEFGDSEQGGDMRTMSLLANGSVSLGTGRLRPYVGLGVGIARHDVTMPRETFEVDGTTYEIPKISEDDIVFAYQAMGGVEFAAWEDMYLRVGYRYFATSDAHFDGVDASHGTHNLEGGVLVRF